jgi:hypothetical protein
MLLGFIACMITIYYLLHAGKESLPSSIEAPQQEAPKQPTNSADHF